MKKIIISIVFALTLINTVAADVWVDGYFRSDGTYVQGHYRSSPDSSVTIIGAIQETQIHTRGKLAQIVMDLVHLVLQTLLVGTAQHYL